MASGETFLKITDYPFAYSFVFILLAFLGYDVFDEKAIPFLAGAGIGATFLTIVDPFGWMIKGYVVLTSRPSSLKSDEMKQSWNYVKSAFSTKALDVEKDKIVGTLYFFIILIMFALALNSSNEFVERFQISEIIDCDVNCIHETSNNALTIIGSLVFIVIFTKGIKLPNKARIISTYLSSIGTSDIPQESKESISKFIEIGDWKTAEYWEKRIIEDKKFKRGKREIIIKSAETIFRPLHIESLSIDSALSLIPKTKTYSRIPIEQWKKITTESAHVMIENTQLRKEISDFYDKIEEFNELAVSLNYKTKEQISKEASEVFKRDVLDISYWIVHNKIEHKNPDLLSCVLFITHPLQTEKNAEPLQLDLNIIDKEKGTKKQITIPKGNVEFHKFELFWENIIKTIDFEGELTQLDTLRTELKLENSELQQKYQEMIELQWKV